MSANRPGIARTLTYSVAVWTSDIRGSRLAHAGEVEFSSGKINTKTKAGNLFFQEAILFGLLSVGDFYLVDVADDVTNVWHTMLSGEVGNETR